MTGDSTDFFALLGDIFSLVTNSAVFNALQWFLMLYAIVLLVDVILLLILRGVTDNLKTQFYGTTDRPLISKNTVLKRFEGIEERLRARNPSQYKVAVLEADHMADELLAGIGYEGENMGERLSNIQVGQVESLEDLQKAHATRNRIVNEPNFTVSLEETQALLEAYRKFFIELELF